MPGSQLRHSLHSSHSRSAVSAYAGGKRTMDHLEPVLELRRSRYAEPRHVAPADWERFERHVAEILAAFGMDLDTPERADAGPLPAGAVRRDRRLRGRRKAADRVPQRIDELAPRRDRRGADRVRGTLRAPCAPVHGRRPSRLRRRRADHRDLEADAARASLRAPVHGAGAPRRADRGRARRADRAARRRRPPDRLAPLHADARSRGALAHGDHALARRVRGRAAAERVSRRGSRTA